MAAPSVNRRRTLQQAAQCALTRVGPRDLNSRMLVSPWYSAGTTSICWKWLPPACGQMQEVLVRTRAHAAEQLQQQDTHHFVRCRHVRGSCNLMQLLQGYCIPLLGCCLGHCCVLIAIGCAAARSVKSLGRRGNRHCHAVRDVPANFGIQLRLLRAMSAQSGETRGSGTRQVKLVPRASDRQQISAIQE